VVVTYDNITKSQCFHFMTGVPFITSTQGAWLEAKKKSLPQSVERHVHLDLVRMADSFQLINSYLLFGEWQKDIEILEGIQSLGDAVSMWQYAVDTNREAMNLYERGLRIRPRKLDRCAWSEQAKILNLK